MSWQAVFITKFVFFVLFSKTPIVMRYVEVWVVPAGASPESCVPSVADGPRSMCEVRETRHLDNYVRWLW